MTQRTFTKSLVPVKPEKLYKCELIANISCGLPGFEGARARTYTERGDILELDRQTCLHFLNNKWVLLLKGEEFPGEELPSFGEVPNFDKLPAKPTKAPKERVKIRVLRDDVVIGHGVISPAINSRHTIPTGSAIYLQSLGAVAICDDELPEPEVKLSVIRGEPNTSPGALTASSFLGQVDRRLRR